MDGVGVWGSVGKSFGVLGESTTGIGVVGRSDGGTGVFGSVKRDRPGGLAGRFVGPVVIEGDLTVTGVKGAVVPHSDGSHRLLCAIESPEGWFEDFGEASLKDGKAEVRLDAEFAAVVETKGYHVGSCAGTGGGKVGRLGCDSPGRNSIIPARCPS